MSTFNLFDEPWIPVIWADGGHERISLKKCLMKAHEISEVYHDSPLVVVGVYRLLLAVVYRLFSPDNSSEWEELWAKGYFDKEIIESYTKKWHSRFFLFDEKYPFYQVAEHPAGDEKLSINKIVIHRAAGNNAVFFDHSNDEKYDPLQPADAILHLLAFQVFSPGGGKSKTINYQHSQLTSPLITFLFGENLYQTLLLNTFIEPPINSGSDDKPYWEQDGKIEYAQVSKISGYLDYLTLQSRMVKLSYKETETGIIVDSVQLAQGRGLDKVILEPFAKYKLNKEEGLIPVRVSIEKQLWREYHSFISLAGGEGRPPLNLKQAAVLEERNILPKGSAFRLFCCGMATDKAKILLWRNEKLPLPLELLCNTDLMSIIESSMMIASEKANLLWKRTRSAAQQLISYNPLSADKEAAKQIQKTISTEAMYWALLETPFKEFVTMAAGGPEMEEKAFKNWKYNCSTALEECWSVVENSIINSAYGPEAIARAFNNNLK